MKSATEILQLSDLEKEFSKTRILMNNSVLKVMFITKFLTEIKKLILFTKRGAKT